jgi:hypothetical protein
MDWWNDPEALDIKTKWSDIKRLTEYFSSNLSDKGKMYDLNCHTCGKPIRLGFIPPVPYCREHLEIYRRRK